MLALDPTDPANPFGRPFGRGRPSSSLFFPARQRSKAADQHPEWAAGVQRDQHRDAIASRLEAIATLHRLAITIRLEEVGGHIAIRSEAIIRLDAIAIGGWRPSQLGWRPWPLGWRPLPSIIRLEAITSRLWRPSPLGWRMLEAIAASKAEKRSTFLDHDLWTAIVNQQLLHSKRTRANIFFAQVVFCSHWLRDSKSI